MGKLTESQEAFAELYGVVCDVFERAWHRMPIEPVEGEPGYTSPDARKAANRVMAELAGIWDVDSRMDAEIRAAENEHFDRLWYYRTMSTPRLRTLPEAQAAIKRIEATYGDLRVDPAEARFIEGKLSALRWVLGDEWDVLDT